MDLDYRKLEETIDHQISEIAENSDVEVEIFLHGSGCSNINVKPGIALVRT